jgi:carboxypeptidase Taq
MRAMPSDAHTPYPLLLRELREIALLKSVSSLLSWDEQTQMPPRGAAHRADEAALLAKLAHERFTSGRTGELLAGAEADLTDAERRGDSDAAANVRETRRSFDRARKLPTALVEELSRTEVLAQQAWADARKRSDFGAFEPWLTKTLDLKRQQAACIGYAADGEPYDALLDEYEPGETAAGITRVFESLRGPLVDLIGRIGASPRKTPSHLLNRHFPAAAQERLAREAAAAAGFDFSAGRLDVSVHPFCLDLGPGDVRITTRYHEDDFADAFFGVLHETGHALYEQGIMSAHFGTPLGEAVSLGIHESQSRMWENFVGRGRAFWKWWLPRARQAFPQALGDVGEGDWYTAVNDVRPSLIRTEADETTYNLHVLLRFDLERAMLRGELGAGDVPSAWNEKMRQYLGLAPPDDARGCLQDIHWSGGAVGYFPTYTLGNLYAAQFFERARSDVGDLDGMIGAGNFAPLLAWLRDRIHRHGKRYTARRLVKQVTGAELSADPLLRHLRAKASEVHGV